MFGGISVWQLAIVLGIVILIFGTKKLRNLGGDLGGAIKSFKKAVDDGGDKKTTETDSAENPAIEGSAHDISGSHQDMKNKDKA